MAFRHALRVSELVDLRWQQAHLDKMPPRSAKQLPSMLFVAIKTQEQQAALMLHRVPSTSVFWPLADIPARSADVCLQGGGADMGQRASHCCF